MARLARYVLYVAAALALLLPLLSCPTQGTKPAPENASVSGDIGPEGGTLEGPFGSKIVVPAGALDTTTTIGLTAYTSSSTLPAAWSPLPGFLGAIEAQPDGQAFNSPVTLTLPLSPAMTPGAGLPLLGWNDSLRQWEKIGTATVDPGGKSCSASVTHFSAYTGGSFASLASDGAGAFLSDYASWFRQNVKDLGDKRAKDNECYKVVGILFDLHYEINGVADDPNTSYAAVGQTSACDSDAPLSMFSITLDAYDGYSAGSYVDLIVTVYYDCTPPELSLSADRTVLPEGEQAELRAKLLCDGTPLSGKTVDFEVASGPGQVSPGSSSTDGSGQATSTFIAGEQDAVVRASYSACASCSPSETSQTLTLRAAPDEYHLTITFEQTTAADDFNLFFTYSCDAPFSVTGDNGDGTAPVEGSGTCDASGGGTNDDCTITITGSVTFSISGTLLIGADGSKTLDLTVEPSFDTWAETVCDDDSWTNPFVVGQESFEYSFPVEDGYTIDHSLTQGPVTSHITYVLTY